MNRTLATTFQELRAERGNPSFVKLRDQVRDLLGDGYCPSDETLRRYHSPDEAEKIKGPLDLIIVSALAKIYGVSLKERDPEVAKALEQARDLLNDASKWKLAR